MDALKRFDTSNLLNVPQSIVERLENNLQSLMKREKEVWLVAQCRKTLEDASQWSRDYTDAPHYEGSSESYRQRWSQTIGEMKFDADFNPQWEPFFENEKVVAKWLYIDLAEGLKARAVLALPKNGKTPFPLIIAQHGVSSSPANVFGFNNPDGAYHSYGLALLKQGFAVLAPANISFAHPRTRLHRLCLLLGTTLAGLEVGKLRRLLDYVVTLPEIDEDRIGMWGLSHGGHYTMFTAPLEKRIKAAIVCAFFNDRLHKMAISSPLYSCFLDVDDEHIWIPGWFKGGFTDSNLLSLVCPRAVQIQQGKADGIGWWPLQEAEYQRLKAHYVKLEIEDRVEYAGHNWGHEIMVDEGIAFLRRWLDIKKMQ
jgi:hypothetical protein